MDMGTVRWAFHNVIVYVKSKRNQKRRESESKIKKREIETSLIGRTTSGSA